MNSDEDFEKRVRADLKRSVQDLDPGLRARLGSMASAAARHSGTRGRKSWLLALPAGGGVAAAALMVFLWTDKGVDPARHPTGAEDLSLLLNVENLELLEQMEFYRWLDQQPGVLDDPNPTSSQRS